MVVILWHIFWCLLNNIVWWKYLKKDNFTLFIAKSRDTRGSAHCMFKKTSSKRIVRENKKYGPGMMIFTVSDDSMTRLILPKKTWHFPTMTLISLCFFTFTVRSLLLIYIFYSGNITLLYSRVEKLLLLMI